MWRFVAIALAIGFMGGAGVRPEGLPASLGASTLIYSTGFEQAEGYNPGFTLVGQKGWMGEGTGGNEVLHGTDQEALIGSFAPTADVEYSTSVWKPLNIPGPPTGSVVRFSVDLAVIDSTSVSPNRDEFRWSVYNTNAPIPDRLFTLILDNNRLSICYMLSDGTTVDTGVVFTNGVLYNLVIQMDFAGNRWNASLGGLDLRINQPIATGAQARNLGDIDAVWFYYDPLDTGDNYMLFDNYRVSVEKIDQPSLQVVSATGGQFRFRVIGQNGQNYAVETSSSLASNSWASIRTNTITAGSFNVTNSIPPAPSRRFFRARWLL